MNDYHDIHKLIQEHLDRGATEADLVGWLKSKGLSRIQSSVALREALHISLGEAKRLVFADPLWLAEQEKTETLHDALEDLLEQEHIRHRINTVKRKN